MWEVAREAQAVKQRTKNVVWCLPALVLVAPMYATGQTTQPADVAALSADEQERLRQSRGIIENPDDSLGTRQAQAESLLRTGWAAATRTLGELLSPSSHASTRVAVCQAIVSVGAVEPALLQEHHAGLVEPLLRLLGDPAEGVSARAAAALAAYPDGGVTERLGVLAADAQASPEQRAAAVDALASSVHKRAVARQIVALLPTENAELRARALRALRCVSRRDYGEDVAAWQAWWEREESTLSDEDWLREKGRMFFQRLLEAQGELERVRADQERRYGTLAERLPVLLRQNYRLVPQRPQKDEMLARWLNDDQPEFRLTALAIISEEIQEGVLPADSLVAAVIAGLEFRVPEVRRAALGIIGAMGVPENAEAVVALLRDEQVDASARQTAFRVLGQLRNPAAIPTLIREIDVSQSPGAPAGCVAEAAGALAVLGARGKVDPEVIAPAVPVLLDRLARTPVDQMHVRGFLLRAMAGIAAPEFGPALTEALRSEQAPLLVPAIEGLAALGDASCLDRLVALVGHTDPRVREAAARAWGNLGSEAAHLEALMRHLSPPGETNDAVRAEAWNGWREMLARKPAEDRLRWADRLREMPDRQQAYLEELVRELSGHNPAPPELAASRERLATLLMARGDAAAALQIWQRLLAGTEAADDASAGNVRVHVLTAAAASGRYELVAEMLIRLAGAPDEVRGAAADETAKAISDRLNKGDLDGLRALLAALEPVDLDPYKPELHTAVGAAKKRLAEPPPAPATAPATTAPTA